MSELPPLELGPLPEIDLRHMLVLTDDTAMLQHATHATPDLYHGYCTDDNARALIAGVLYSQLQPEQARADGSLRIPDELAVAMQRYLAFLSYAFNKGSGRFRNLMDYNRNWAEGIGSEDSHARALWGLGVAARRVKSADIHKLAYDLFRQAMPAAEGFGNLRPWAYVLIGLAEYLRAGGDDGGAVELRDRLAGRLMQTWRRNATGDWPWWEDSLTWGNAKLPHALLVAGTSLSDAEMTDTALTALRWLLEVQTGDAGQLSIIGNNGWYVRGRRRARFDQQPIEAKALVQACLAAAAATGDSHWTAEAQRCFEWFLGNNDVGEMLYNIETGGCQDGLGPDGTADNQGAESTLAYILSVLELHLYDRAQKAGRGPGI